MAHAQPVAGAAVAPPARVDAGLRGSVLATRQVADHRACLSECQRTAGCTGYNFDRAAKASCSVLGGTLSDVVARGVVSCRMPCEVGPRTALLSQRQGAAAATLQPAPARPARLAGGTASASAASFGTGPVTGTLPPCPPGRAVVVAGSSSNAAVAVAPPPSSTTVTLLPTHDNTIGSSSLSREQLRACNCNSLDAFVFHSREDAGGRGPKLIVTYQ